MPLATDPVRPMFRDFDQTFREIHGSLAAMRDHVLRLRDALVERDTLYLSSDRLRFIAALPLADPLDNSADIAAEPVGQNDDAEPSLIDLDEHERLGWNLRHGSYRLLEEAANDSGHPVSVYRTLWEVHYHRHLLQFKERWGGGKKGKLAMNSMCLPPVTCHSTPGLSIADHSST